ncbi:hypothetical protein DSL72_002149 [Monilinia vaccinii-corymbosi]|uniref:Uncharacterized protein n=1 Tax=Monilinia vaccinii-corymbosi TaxID=61207 RepID=A0A8A3PBU3_9HELO|nr:hypothetical protein DSL72_002149 [Monilinia vaccinii-corymbosi]
MGENILDVTFASMTDELGLLFLSSEALGYLGYDEICRDLKCGLWVQDYTHVDQEGNLIMEEWFHAGVWHADPRNRESDVHLAEQPTLIEYRNALLRHVIMDRDLRD